MIPGAYRFHGHNSLRYVYSNGKAARSRFATLKWSPNPHRSKSRIAVVVSKKVIKSAIGRNRVRRRVYEFMRHQLPSFNGVFDVVVIVSSNEFLVMSGQELSEQLTQLVEQTALLKRP